jgi:hypothetical protein
MSAPSLPEGWREAEPVYGERRFEGPDGHYVLGGTPERNPTIGCRWPVGMAVLEYAKATAEKVRATRAVDPAHHAEAVVEIQKLLDEVRAEALADGRRRRQVEIVAWLRSLGTLGHKSVFDELADAIERGEAPEVKP